MAEIHKNSLAWTASPVDLHVALMTLAILPSSVACECLHTLDGLLLPLLAIEIWMVILPRTLVFQSMVEVHPQRYSVWGLQAVVTIVDVDSL